MYSRSCFAFIAVLYMAVLLVHVEVSSANNATEAVVTKKVEVATTPAAENPAGNATEAPAKPTEAPAKATTAAAPTEAPKVETTAKSGVEGMFSSVLPIATYALWLVLVAIM